jgi:hypothetical protein
MTEWHGGKGSKPRPYSVTQEEYDKRWDAIFGKDIPEDENDDNELDDEDFDDEHTEEE